MIKVGEMFTVATDHNQLLAEVIEGRIPINTLRMEDINALMDGLMKWLVFMKRVGRTNEHHQVNIWYQLLLAEKRSRIDAFYVVEFGEVMEMCHGPFKTLIEAEEDVRRWRWLFAPQPKSNRLAVVGVTIKDANLKLPTVGLFRAPQPEATPVKQYVKFGDI